MYEKPDLITIFDHTKIHIVKFTQIGNSQNKK